MNARSSLLLLALAVASFWALPLDDRDAKPRPALPEPSVPGDRSTGVKIGLQSTGTVEGTDSTARREAPEPAGRALPEEARRLEAGQLEITLRAALDGALVEGALLTFRYRHAAGKPLEEPLPPVRATTGAEGRAELRVASGWQGWLDVAASPSTAASGAPAAAGRAVAPLAPGERHEMELALDTGSSTGFWLRVVDDEGAPVRARLRWAGGGAEGPVALAGPDGLVRLTSARPAGRSIRVEAPHHLEAVVPPPAEEEWDGAAREVVLRRTASLILRLPAGHDPRALLLEAGEPGSPRGAGRAARFEGGCARLPDLPPGRPLALRLATHEGRFVRALPTLTLAPGEEREMAILAPAAAITGALRGADGSPLAGCDVEAFRASEPHPEQAPFAALEGERRHPEVTGRARADGTFALEGLAEGWWTVVARPDGFGAVARTLWLEQAETESLSLVAHRGGWLRGRVVDESGRVVADAVVEAWSTDGSESLLGETDAEGRFLLGPASAEEHWVRAFSPWRYSTPAQACVRPGASVTLVASRGGELLLRVLSDATGRAAPASVAVHAGERAVLARTDPDGHARLRGLHPGHHRVTVAGDDGSFGEAIVPVRAGATSEATLLLRREATLLLAHGSDSSAAYEIRHRDDVVRHGSLDGVRALELAVPVGEILVEVSADGRRATRRVEVRRGERREVRFP